jgi:FAD/FMN-containing dehydrogenase
MTEELRRIRFGSFVRSVEELQTILRDTNRFPGPVRAMGSYHSLTPSASSGGTMIDMSGLNRLLSIDSKHRTVTAQAGLQSSTSLRTSEAASHCSTRVR